MYSIKLSEDAFCDIEEIFSFISQDNKAAAEKLRTGFYNKIKNLQQFPTMGPLVSDLDAPGAERGYRYVVVSPYIIFYRIKADNIIIARVLHTKQNWLQMLFGKLM